MIRSVSSTQIADVPAKAPRDVWRHCVTFASGARPLATILVRADRHQKQPERLVALRGYGTKARWPALLVQQCNDAETESAVYTRSLVSNLLVGEQEFHL